MKKSLMILIVVALMMAMIPVNVFAAGPTEYTIDVRNRTGEPVELNYRGSDGVPHFVTVEMGVSSLTLTEGVYSYWASPNCGHIAGTMNISQQRQILWISCDDAAPSLTITKPEAKKAGCAPISGTGLGSAPLGFYILLTCDWTLDQFLLEFSTIFTGVEFGEVGPLDTAYLFDFCASIGGAVWTDDLYQFTFDSSSPLGPLPACDFTD